jgi:hypothetical protein
MAGMTDDRLPNEGVHAEGRVALDAARWRAMGQAGGQEWASWAMNDECWRLEGGMLEVKVCSYPC